MSEKSFNDIYSYQNGSYDCPSCGSPLPPDLVGSSIKDVFDKGNQADCPVANQSTLHFPLICPSCRDHIGDAWFDFGTMNINVK